MALKISATSVFVSSKEKSSLRQASSYSNSKLWRYIAVKAVGGIRPKQSKQRRPQNVDGDFFVDHTCIDCDTCRWMAPQIFTRVDEMSAVYRQPTCAEERGNALQALLSCPTSSIRTEKPPSDIVKAQQTFPLPIDEQGIPGVYHCGFHSEKSYGAASYLVVHPEGNIIIDRDDIADHYKWSKRLSCDRILHSQEVQLSTADVEIKLEGIGPWNLSQDIQLIHTPGHTEGSVCLFYKSLKILFTGDHLAMTESGLSIGEKYNQCSVLMQLNSVRALMDLDFKWIIPGHGRRIEFKDYLEKNLNLEDFLLKHSQYDH
ncbi:uncharacterized protein LOC119998476 isoform X2 [Tripterygium wilfordii]|uniref:uncharacterized protein LOC119998476 isoform X2 n=1 Tax=Tripterygium wilfordii TaxID=458696 RepID=UPI0018F84701|nr:uncharacterized protein LOC119998476 isoform X2 [Tripterygium wilfordii]